MMQSSFPILRIPRLQRLSRLYASIPLTTSTTRHTHNTLSSIASHTRPFSLSHSYGASEQSGSPDPLIPTEEQKVTDYGLLTAILENLKTQQIKLSEIQVAIRAAIPIFLGEEQKARKKELYYAIKENEAARKIKLEEIKAATEIKKDSQRVIDLTTELRNLKAARRKLITEIIPLGRREEEGKEHIVSPDDEEKPSA